MDDEMTRIPIRPWKVNHRSGTADLDQSIDVMRTLEAIEYSLGRPPTLAEILYMTAWAEYYSVVDARDLGLEGLTRNLYKICGRPYCTQSRLIIFLSGYQPWTGYKNEVDGDPDKRAKHLLKQLGNLQDKTTDPLWLAINNTTLIRSEVKIKGWDYIKGDKIQQWFTVLGESALPTGKTIGYLHTDYAILAVKTTDGMFYMFTYCQTLHFHDNHTDAVCEPQQ